MTDKITMIIIFLAVAVSLEAVQEFQVNITKPTDNAKVDRPTVIEGTVSGSNADVYIIVHPAGVDEYWVQPKASVKNKKWSSTIYVGSQSNIKTNRQFELMAVANPENALREGDVLDRWPDSGGKSQIIHITRRLNPSDVRTRSNKSSMKGSPLRLSNKISKEKMVQDKAEGTQQSAAFRETGENDKFVIQVGSWRNLNFANEVYVKLQKYYPNAYLISDNNFSIVRIPNVKTKVQGDEIVRHIEKKFNLKPLLMLKKSTTSYSTDY